jgi:hypothetical protein
MKAGSDMNEPPPPILRDFLVMIGRSGVKAVAAAIDSVLEDAQGIADEAGRRVRKGRKRLHKIRRKDENVVEAEDE